MWLEKKDAKSGTKNVDCIVFHVDVRRAEEFVGACVSKKKLNLHDKFLTFITSSVFSVTFRGKILSGCLLLRIIHTSDVGGVWQFDHIAQV